MLKRIGTVSYSIININVKTNYGLYLTCYRFPAWFLEIAARTAQTEVLRSAEVNPTPHLELWSVKMTRGGVQKMQDANIDLWKWILFTGMPKGAKGVSDSRSSHTLILDSAPLSNS